jgi:hypothetical protein
MARGDGEAQLGQINRSETLGMDDLRSRASSSRSERRLAYVNDSAVLLAPLERQQDGYIGSDDQQNRATSTDRPLVAGVASARGDWAGDRRSTATLNLLHDAQTIRPRKSQFENASDDQF